MIALAFDDSMSDTKGPSDKALLKHIRSERNLAVHQANKRAEKALKSPLQSLGYRVREGHDNGHSRGRPATVWDIPRSLPPKGKERRHEEDEWGDDEEWHEDDGDDGDDEEAYCTWCAMSGHIWKDCPDRDADRDGDSYRLEHVPLRELGRRAARRTMASRALQSVEPFDCRMTRTCGRAFSTEEVV